MLHEQGSGKVKGVDISGTELPSYVVLIALPFNLEYQGTKQTRLNAFDGTFTKCPGTGSTRVKRRAHSEPLSFRPCVCNISMTLCFRLFKGSLRKGGGKYTFRVKDVVISQSIYCRPFSTRNGSRGMRTHLKTAVLASNITSLGERSELLVDLICMFDEIA